MSRAESGPGRRGRRGGSRRADTGPIRDRADDYGHDEEYDYDPEEDFSAEYGHTAAGDEGAGENPDTAQDGDDERAGSGRGRGRRRGSRRAAPAKDARQGGVKRVSAFSASAIKKVSVLGDRPNQIVYTLAEQSKRKRGTAVLGVLIGAFALSLVALLGLLSYQLFTGAGGTTSGGDTSVVAPPEGHSTITPQLYLSNANRDDVFGPINERPEGLEPMTQEAVFDPVQEVELDGMKLELRDGAVTDSCTSLVWGDDLGQSLIDAGCVNAASGVYTDADEEYVAQVTLFDLSDAEAATEVEAALDPNNVESGAGFLLSRTNDEIPGLQDGYSEATAQVMGHYLAVFWVARTDGSPPGDDTDLAKVTVASMNAFPYVYNEVIAAQAEQE
ncbi:hypothetical protein ACOQFV_12875 [Nocardiopsis changdeensis]|uniref:Uncharacterized protein n=1 Tax=Nocardiopsis changdeensis TaxID=2831969 RepID=A0ABX8BG71_9ACTN|nr:MULTISPECIES: hypothetical protein [Nocardiopsis]QUX21225.1 hypothetical protein KGD84_22695 [Nocardiopsis changdeensis]QYX37156.1 hypothetical protein K1J57_00065 [Nocardiopsis sp. MT53]